MKEKRPTLSFSVANVQTQRRGGADTGGRRLRAGAVCPGFPVLRVWAFGMTLCRLPRRPCGQKSACRCRRQETGVWSLGPGDPLEEEMATHSRLLAWRIPWTGDSLRGLRQRDRQNWAHMHNTRFQTTEKKQPWEVRCEQKNRHFTSKML